MPHLKLRARDIPVLTGACFVLPLRVYSCTRGNANSKVYQLHMVLNVTIGVYMVSRHIVVYVRHSGPLWDVTHATLS